MASSLSTMDFLLDVLSDSRQVSSRRMFGEFCLYYAGRPVGLVCDDQLYLKPSEPGSALMKDMTLGAPFPGARMHLLISPDLWDDRAWMNRIVRATFESLPAPKPPALPKTKKVSPSATQRAGTTSTAKGDTAIQALPNLGPKSAQMLQAAGVTTLARLRKLGAVAAYAQVKQQAPRASLNLLWALEGALTNLPWQTVARDHRTSLLLALEQHLARSQPAVPRSRQPKKK